MTTDLSALMTTERKYLADMLAGPLAKMLTVDGSPTTREELESLILDPEVEVRFPKFTIHKHADVEVEVEVEVEVTEVTTSGATRRLRKLQKVPDQKAKSQAKK